MKELGVFWAAAVCSCVLPQVLFFLPVHSATSLYTGSLPASVALYLSLFSVLYLGATSGQLNLEKLCLENSVEDTFILKLFLFIVNSHLV